MTHKPSKVAAAKTFLSSVYAIGITWFPANIRLGKDVLKTSSVVFQDVFKTYLQDIFLKTFSRRLEDILKKMSCKLVMKKF